MRPFRVLAATTLAVTIAAFATAADNADPTLISNGKTVFTQHCIRCHGAEAKGDGVDAKRLVVQPRDLTSGRFKWKTTVQGTPPSDEDIRTGIIGHGLAGSGMPSFNNLNDETKNFLVAYIKSISPAFKNAQAPQAIPLPSNLKASPDLKKGAEVFAKLQCALCHGENGRANGTSAFTLKDAWQRPIRPADLTQGWTYRGGNRPLDIYYRMLAGIDGAPMPSYEGAATHEEAWLLSCYVASLQIKPNFSKDIYAQRAAGDLPATTDDKAWTGVPHTEVNLENFFYVDGKRAPLTVHSVSVQALFNDKSVAFRLSWDDPTEEKASPSDAFLVAVRPVDYQGDPRGNLLNLYGPTDSALEFTAWQASKADSASQRTSNLATAIRDNWAGTAVPAAAAYKDGNYTLVLRRDIKTGETTRVGFAAWDGHDQETGLKFTGSEWLWLHFGEQVAEHH
jgi:DMSO reductase family type II enzyme heme b subunit